MSMSDRAKARQVEEARKNGELPPEVDNDGNLINPHVPEYMSRAPWYLNQEEGAGLKHQKAQPIITRNKQDFQQHSRIQGIKGQTRAKYGLVAKHRRGGAANDDDGLSRPSRKRRRVKTGGPAPQVPAFRGGSSSSSSSFSGGGSGGDMLTYDAKRDRYNGYDPELHIKNMEKYEREQALRQKLKEEEKIKQLLAKQQKALQKAAASSSSSTANDDDDSELSDTALSDSDDDLDDDLDGDDDDDVKLKAGKAVLFGSTQGKTFHKMTERNLRIREHTAKYLLNLDPNSAHYDPKSRSMRSNPRPQEIAEDSTYGGDNFIRHTGDVSELANTQLFAWEAYNKGEDAAHLQANPTQVELARKQFHERKEKILEAKKKKRLEKYGGQEHMKQLKHAERFGEESRYVEYDSNGNVVKGFEVAAPRSKYIEDQHPHGHTSTWGSYFDKDTLKWGYACCWQTTKAAFCVGEDGKKAILEGKRWLQEAGQSEKSKGTGVNHANAADKKREERPNFDKSGTRNDGWDRDGDFNAMGTREAIDQEKLQKAMAEEREKKRTSKNEGNKAEKPSGFGESYSDETPEIIEARKLLKERKNDPMASMGNELLPMESGDKKKNDQLRQTA